MNNYKWNELELGSLFKFKKPIDIDHKGKCTNDNISLIKEKQAKFQQYLAYYKKVTNEFYEKLLDIFRQLDEQGRIFRLYEISFYWHDKNIDWYSFCDCLNTVNLNIGLTEIDDLINEFWKHLDELLNGWY